MKPFEHSCVCGGNIDRPNDDCERCQMHAEILILRRRVGFLHDATIVLRNGMGGHNHWDYTMMHGAGCETCIAQTKARNEANRLIKEAGSEVNLTNPPRQ